MMNHDAQSIYREFFRKGVWKLQTPYQNAGVQGESHTASSARRFLISECEKYCNRGRITAELQSRW